MGYKDLYISLGRASRAISYDQLDWDNMGAQNSLTLLDPLNIIDWPYFILEAKSGRIKS